MLSKSQEGKNVIHEILEKIARNMCIHGKPLSLSTWSNVKFTGYRTLSQFVSRNRHIRLEKILHIIFTSIGIALVIIILDLDVNR